MKLQITSKRAIELDRDESSLLLIIAAATILTVFCLVSAKALISQTSYQRRVINARHAATAQIQANIQKANSLVTQYNDVFEGSNATNILGGKNTNSANAVPPDGTNGRIVLDALPTTYDFPALLTSIQKVVTADGIGGPAIGGSDQSSTATNTPSAKPQPVKIDLSLSGSATYTGVQSLIKDLERSIRPFDITKLTLSGNESSMVVSLHFSTYYQPAKSLTVNSMEIR